jgi:hypothetical protein
MKHLIILPFLFLATVPVFSQSNIAMGQEFAELAAHHGLAGKGFAAFQGYTSGDVTGSPYFFSDWSDGELTTVHKEVYGEGLQFMYDKESQEVYVRKKDSALILNANKDEIQSFSLKDSNQQQRNFVNSKMFTVETPEIFYQVLVYDSARLSLFKYNKTTLVKANLADPAKVNEGDIKDAYVDKPAYFIVKDGALYPVKLRPKSIVSIFEDLNFKSKNYPGIDVYLKAHPQPIDEQYMIAMINYLNSSRPL